ncbi:MAG: hypothetical protein JO288_06845 [Hyphomicrobiales bacterium]|nr:hypothetical protein [Hyphomicrobiales bacterium]
MSRFDRSMAAVSASTAPIRWPAAACSACRAAASARKRREASPIRAIKARCSAV